MSVNMQKPERFERPELKRPIEEIAREHVTDPRIPATVPGFDAPYFQAGMAGYSDGAMRIVARQHGAAFCVTESLLDITLLSGARGRRREDPDILERECGDANQIELPTRGDHPIAGQLMGTEPDVMARAAALLVDFNYDVVDINFACPVKKIKKANRGGHFLTAPNEALAVLAAVREAVPDQTPTTVKLRRSYDESPEMVDAFYRIFEGAYELGYAWATVHCRTVEQKYQGPGRWAFLKELVERYPDRLIFGSGDIWSPEDIFAMLESTGVHAVSVARGCIGDPWIFHQAEQLRAGKPVTEPSLLEQRRVLLDHLELTIALHGEYTGSRLMRKFVAQFSRRHPQASQVKAELVRCESLDQWRDRIDFFYPS